MLSFNDGFNNLSSSSPLGNAVSRYLLFSVVVSVTYILFTSFAYFAVVSKLYYGYIKKGKVASFGTLIINHRTDTAFAKRLDKKLIASGVSNWLASRCAGVEDELTVFQDTLNAMSSVSHVILVLSPASIQSRSCLRLINEAYELEKNIQPVMCSECYVERGAIRMMLLRKSIVDFTRNSFSSATADLMAQLSASIEDNDNNSDENKLNDDDDTNSGSRVEQRRIYYSQTPQKRNSFGKVMKNMINDRATKMERSENSSNSAFARLYMGYRVGIAAFILVIVSSIALFILGQYSSRYNQSLTSLATNVAGAIAALFLLRL